MKKRIISFVLVMVMVLTSVNINTVETNALTMDEQNELIMDVNDFETNITEIIEIETDNIETDITEVVETETDEIEADITETVETEKNDAEIDYAKVDNVKSDDTEINSIENNENSNIIASGECGENLTWEINKNGELIISGTGAMYEYESKRVQFDEDSYTMTGAPWYEYGEPSFASDWDDSWREDYDEFSDEPCFDTIIMNDGVTEISKAAFDSLKNVKNISIPDSVTYIGDWAFSDTSISELTIPDSVTYIGKQAFRETSITELTIPDSVTYIGAWAFGGTSITEIAIPERTDCIVGEDAFFKCNKLKKATINGDIGMYAFEKCESLETIIIGDKTTKIRGNAFAGCSAFKAIIISDKITNKTTNIDKAAFYFCTLKTAYAIPESYGWEWATNQKVWASGSNEKFTVVDSRNPFTVTFDSNGGSMVESQLIKPEVCVRAIRPDNPTRSEYVFDNWYLLNEDGSLSETPYDFDKLVTGNITLVAKWVIPVTVTFNADNGTDVVMVNVASGETITKIDDPVKDGYYFLGWYLGDAVYDFDSVVNEDITLVAKWVIPVTVTFNADNGTDVVTVNMAPNEAVTKIDDPIKDGYYFLGWYLSDTEYDFESPVTENITLVAKWVIPEIVTFNPDNGTDVVVVKVAPGEKVAKIDEPTKEGHYFLGWYLGDTIYDFDSAVTEDIILTAKWHYMETVGDPESSIPSNTAVYRGTAISLTSKTPDALIYYTIDGSDPTVESGILYQDAIVIERDVTIKAFAVKDELWHNSAVVTFVYTAPDTGDVLFEDIPESGVDTIPEGFWIAGVEEAYTYTGSAIKPVFRVYDYTTLLKEKTDYTVTYKNNTKANDGSVAKTAPTITITGKGNYSGKVTQTFAIVTKDIADTDILAENIVVKYNGKTQKNVPTMMYNGKKLKNNTDYTVTYPDLETNKEAYKLPGTYKVVITGKGNYGGSREVTFTVTEATLMSKVSITKIANQVYTGVAIEPVVTVKNGKATLVKDTDYTVSYSNNTEIGKAIVTVTGIGNYVGSKTATFNITGINMKSAKVANVPKSVAYTGNEITADAFETRPVLTIKAGKETVTLTENVDYVVGYSKNINKGTATITFTGIGKYTGTVKKTFAIKAYSFATVEDNKVSVLIDDCYKYAKGGVKPEPVVMFGNKMLVKGTDYTVTYKNNTKVNDGSVIKTAPRIIVTGKGNYTGSMTVYFAIEQQDISLLEMTVADKTYANKNNAYKSTPVIKDFDGKTLKFGTDYEKNLVYTYKKRTKTLAGIWRGAGSVVDVNDIVPADTIIVVTATGKGNYMNTTVSAEYRVTTATINNASVTVPKQNYTGEAIEPSTNEITVKVGGTELTTGDYEIVGYSNNVNKGTATLTIKGKGNYGGTKTVKFTIQTKKFVWYWDMSTMSFKMREV